MIMDTGLAVTDFGWTDVAGFAAMAVLTDFGAAKEAGEETVQRFRTAVLAEADRLAALGERNAFGMAMGAGDFCSEPSSPPPPTDARPHPIHLRTLRYCCPQGW